MSMLMLMLILCAVVARVSSNRVVDVPLRQPFGGFCRYHPWAPPLLLCTAAPQYRSFHRCTDAAPCADVVLMFVPSSARTTAKNGLACRLDPGKWKESGV